MNYLMPAARPFMALVDDDFHSARMMTRMLLAHGAPSVRWMDGPAAAAVEIGALLASEQSGHPALVIVDLKSSSRATAEFIATIRALPKANDLLIAAFAPTLDREVRNDLLDAGADAVFERHADIEAYRRETANIVSFWVRNQRLNAIGT
jgi:response regulator RpfG family c-di-GMP phosphodiesterase